MMADEFGVNRKTIRQILVEDLGNRKVASRCVPHVLSNDQRHERVQYAKDIIKTARRNKNFLNSIVAEVETWRFRNDPTTKRPCAEWKSHASPKGNKVRLPMTMLVCFYDSKGIIHHEFVHEGQTVTGSFWVFWNAYGRGFAVSGPSTQHQAVGFFFTTMHRFTGQLLYKHF